jgi:hypothetical protein
MIGCVIVRQCECQLNHSRFYELLVPLILLRIYMFSGMPHSSGKPSGRAVSPDDPSDTRSQAENPHRHLIQRLPQFTTHLIDISKNLGYGFVELRGNFIIKIDGR